jgi:hypothetical protein
VLWREEIPIRTRDASCSRKVMSMTESRQPVDYLQHEDATLPKATYDYTQAFVPSPEPVAPPPPNTKRPWWHVAGLIVLIVLTIGVSVPAAVLARQPMKQKVSVVGIPTIGTTNKVAVGQAQATQKAVATTASSVPTSTPTPMPTVAPVPTGTPYVGTSGQQQAVSDANTAVSGDLSNLQGDISILNQSATFDSVLSAYAKDWQQMQIDYQTEVNDSKNGCGNGNYNYGTVQYDAGSVKYDLRSIQYDAGSYDYQKNGIDGAYSSVQRDITTLKNDWQTLQQAIANNSTGTPGSNYQQSDIDNAVANGNNALSNADNVVQNAKQKRTTYDSEASSLNDQAQAKPGTMRC